MFPEGAVTNGLNMARFQRGAFAGNKAVMPCMFKYDYKTISPDYAGGISGSTQTVISNCELTWCTVNLNSYPVFVPNDYLYTEYAKTIPGYENMEKW